MIILLNCFLSAMSIMGFVYGAYFYAISFLLVPIILTLACVSGSIDAKKREPVFLFSINSEGVRHIDANGVFFIPWEDIHCFGYVNDNSIEGIRDYPNCRQTILYFSKSLYTEAYLRKFFWRIGNKRYRHRSSENIITFCFEENTLDEKLLARINEYLYKYSDKSKECNYIR